MPSPSSQNLRSAPQKQPMPKMAVSWPAGYGPLSGRPLTKWLVAVGVGVARPGSAAPGAGIFNCFLNLNLGRAPVLGSTPNIGAARGRRTIGDNHGDECGTSGSAVRNRRIRSRSVARVADERLLLAADQHQDGAENAQHEPGGRGEDAQDD